MLNRSRETSCPECNGANFWKGDPKPNDSLHCRYCKSFIATHGDFVQYAFRREAVAILSAFTESNSEQDLALLETTLANQGHRTAEAQI